MQESSQDTTRKHFLRWQSKFSNFYSHKQKFKTTKTEYRLYPSSFGTLMMLRPVIERQIKQYRHVFSRGERGTDSNEPEDLERRQGTAEISKYQIEEETGFFLQSRTDLTFLRAPPVRTTDILSFSVIELDRDRT